MKVLFQSKYEKYPKENFIQKYFSCAINEGSLHNETLLLAAKNDKPCQHFKKILKFPGGRHVFF